MAPGPRWRLRAGRFRRNWSPLAASALGWERYRPLKSRGVDLTAVTAGKRPRGTRDDGGLLPRQRLGHKGLRKAPWSDTSATSPGAQLLPGRIEGSPDPGVRKGPGAAKRRCSRSEPPSQAAATVPLPSWWVPTMEEMVIWEQHTVTLSKDPQRGFGFAVSGGRDRPNRITGDTAVFVSDVVSGGPAMGRLQRKDHIVMVNGLSMENVPSSFAIQTLKTCGKIANITLKRPRKVYLPVSKSSPGSPAVPRHYDSDEDYGLHGGDPALQRSRDDLDHSQGYDGDSSSERSSGHHHDDDRRHHKLVPRSRRRSQDSSHWRQSPGSGSDQRGRSRHHPSTALGQEGDTNGLALVSGFKRLPRQDVPAKPITSVLVKQKQSEEYGLKLGSQLFIKHIVESGLAAKGNSLQEGDLILKINGVASQDMSLAETQQLIERTEGILTLLILRDHRQFLVNIPDVDSESDSSRMDDISDIDSELSHPPSPDASPPSPAATRMNSPPERRRSNKEPVAEVTTAAARGLDPLEAVEGDGHSPRPAPRAALKDGYSAGSRVVRFVKAKSAGLRLAGGNDVGIFVSSVQEGSPAHSQGIREGDQILQVNDTSFQHLTREEAVEHLMALPVGEEVTLWTQSKPDIYRKMVSSNVGDSFYIRTHFDFEKDTPSGLSFVRGDVFHVLDTMYRGRLGNWLAVRVGRDLQEQDKGIIPNQSRAEQIASLESVLKATSGANPSGARAEFWKLRGLRGAKKMLRKSREDLSALTKQGRYPPYERVVLKEASFKRPVVILGPIADIAVQKLSRELPELFEVAPSVPRDGASSKVIKLDSVRQIAEKGKHALLDITPSAVERLNYVQYYPVVVFCEPESRPGVKAMRQWLAPDSRKSSRRLYAQANKMKKYCSHLFTATVHLSGSGNAWFQQIQDIVRTQQSQPVWTTAEQVSVIPTLQADIAPEDSLDLLNPPSTVASGYLTCDSHANSDYEETDGESGAYTDGEAEDAYDQPGLARSSEPAQLPPGHGLSSSEPAQLSPRHGRSDKVPRQPQQGQHYDSIREYEHEAVRKRFTRARDDSDQDEGYEWGPATDV
ncbi:tight junction protein ZO-3 isoform X1 [Myiozetetes cayanensis]|uniref:tight junction protein ZO-3 isoform X1 n=1 Tax=Myiozetetes cayanensis TaxID=478635 RepID=UPI00215FB0C4|nr:tight junction protein ZO-3 isoform X1 [Myiozetetes cayanensis]